LLLNGALQGKNGRGQTPLAIAVQYGNYDLAKCMLENGAIAQRGQNSGKWSLMDTVAFYNVFAEGQDIPGLLAAKGLRATTIHQAAGVGDVELVKTFLEQDSVSPRQCKDGHRPEACDHPIHWAARSGHADVIRVLLDAGVSLDPQLHPSAITPAHVRICSTV
jgi:ankyrin repeat protein